MQQMQKTTRRSSSSKQPQQVVAIESVSIYAQGAIFVKTTKKGSDRFLLDVRIFLNARTRELKNTTNNKEVIEERKRKTCVCHRICTSVL
jgi:hypothetical protein